MKILGAVCVLLTFCCVSHSSTIYDNTAAITTDSDHVRRFGPLFDSFTTDSFGGALVDLKLILSGDADSTGILRIGLFADDFGVPGTRITRLGRIRESRLTDTPSLYDINLRVNPVLSPDTRYWIRLRSGPTALWGWSEDTSGLGVDSEFFYNTNGLFSNVPSGPYQMSITTAAVPEPASIGLMFVSCGVLGLLSRRFSRIG